MAMLEKFREWQENRHQYAKEWKARTGGKVLGYFCTYVPEEILYAGDILPVRILGSHEAEDVTEPHIFKMFCPFCRDCLAQGLEGRYDYLDGIMIAQSCLHIRQSFTSWRIHIPMDYTYYLPFPHGAQNRAVYQYLTGELEKFKKSIEDWTGKTLTDEDLDRGIEIMDTNRRLMKQVYETRKADNPPLTGLEAMYMVVSSQMTDKRDHSSAVEGVLKDLPSRNLNRETGVRLMIVGSEDDDTEFVQLTEALGSTIVVDEHCTGTRYFWNEVEPQENRLAALAQRYIDRPRCPSKDWPDRTRVQFVVDLAEEYNVEGALVIQQKFCDPHELDIPAVRQALEAKGIPTYFLEFDVTVPIGQFKTRVEAFLEEFLLEDALF